MIQNADIAMFACSSRVGSYDMNAAVGHVCQKNSLLGILGILEFNFKCIERVANRTWVPSLGWCMFLNVT